MTVQSTRRDSIFSIAIEEGTDGGVLVHALTVPGCTAIGDSVDDGLDRFAHTLSEWLAFMQSVGEPVPSRDAELELSVDEWVRTEAAVRSGESYACFEADRHPLGADEVDRGLRLLGSLRGRIIAVAARATDEDLEQLGGDGWTARRLLDELARAEWWTLTRLGSSPLAAVPRTVIGRLDTAMALTLHHLGQLPDDARGRTLLLDGEEWTPRKVLRRQLALEWTLGGAALHALSAHRALPV